MRTRRSRIRRTTTLVLVPLVGIVLSNRIFGYATASVISDRHSIRAFLVLPKELRKFDIETHIKDQDWYVYRDSRKNKKWPYWRLQIFTTKDRLEHFKAVFQKYLEPDRKCNLLYEGYPSGTFLVASNRKRAPALVRFKTETNSKELRITFTYYDSGYSYRALKTRCKDAIASILGKSRPAFRIRDVDVTTCPTCLIAEFEN